MVCSHFIFELISKIKSYILVSYSGIFIFLILGLMNSKILTPLNKIWVKFGELIGKIVAPLVMALIFFIILTPIGLFLRLIGKDLLNIKLNNNKTYWIKRDKKPGSMKRQF